jgi:hypothetical protein
MQGPDANWIMVHRYLPPWALAFGTEVIIRSVNYTCEPAYGNNVTATLRPP